ncbi:MAG: redoxin domain-containing protein [Prevotellaceae bacterium]|jgi:peroxiredoxin|nr:redoxin domain-containing protein [Prevotellaceae bacterium]
MKRGIFLILFFLLCLSEVWAQGYRIEVSVDGVKDTTLYMAIYSGTSKYAIDTAVTDSKGYAVFQKDKPLHGGMYLIAMGGVQILDFLISDSLSQHFSIYTNTDNYYESLKFTGSPENTALLDFQANLQQQQKKINRLLERSRNDESQEQAVKDSIAIVEKEVQEYIKVNREKHKGKLLATILRAAFPPTAPDPNIPEGTPKRDSLLWVHYYQFNKNHFFDNIDFSDARLIYTPILKPRVEEYFTKTLMQLPDSLIPQVDYVLKLAGVNHDMYSTVFSQLFNKYVEAEIMGMEKVAIYIGEHYILTGKADWIEGEAKEKIKDFVEHNRYSLIGMQAKDLKLQSITGQFESIYDINSPYLVLVFYEPDCGHCRKEVPLIYEVYRKYKNKGVQAFAVCGEYKYDKWVKFVTENNLDWINVWDGYNKQDDVSIGSHFREYYNVYSTPQVYLLDKDKKIIGRRLNAEVLTQILKHELGETTENEQ